MSNTPTDPDEFTDAKELIVHMLTHGYWTPAEMLDINGTLTDPNEIASRYFDSYLAMTPIERNLRFCGLDK